MDGDPNLPNSSLKVRLHNITMFLKIAWLRSDMALPYACCAADLIRQEAQSRGRIRAGFEGLHGAPRMKLFVVRTTTAGCRL